PPRGRAQPKWPSPSPAHLHPHAAEARDDDRGAAEGALEHDGAADHAAAGAGAARARGQPVEPARPQALGDAYAGELTQTDGRQRLAGGAVVAGEPPRGEARPAWQLHD